MSTLEEEVYIMVEALKLLLPYDCDIDSMQEFNDEQKKILKKAKEISDEN